MKFAFQRPQMQQGGCLHLHEDGESVGVEKEMKGVRNATWVWARCVSPEVTLGVFIFRLNNSHPEENSASCVQRHQEGAGKEPTPGALSLAPARPVEGSGSTHPDLPVPSIAE